MIPLLILGLLLPVQITVVVAGMHLSAFRIFLLPCWIRCMLRREYRPWIKSKMDTAVMCWALSNALAFILLWREAASIANRAGFLYSTLGTYFLLRCYVKDKESVIRVIKAFVLAFAIVAPLMLSERLTGYNTFALVGGAAVSSMREGKARAQGPFLHAIIAGTVSALLIPLCVGLWQEGKSYRLAAGVGLVSGTIGTLTAVSSTPIMTCAAGVAGLFFFRARKKMRAIRWGIVAALAGLQVVMKAPVWFVIAHLSNFMGGSGFHRAELIDNFVRHFGEWWLIGTRNSADWGYYMWDVDNAYVSAGTGGGLLTFILFIGVIVCGYKTIGRVRVKAEGLREELWLIWALGCALFANTVAFFGIVYFDQSVLIWYALLAMIAAGPAILTGAGMHTRQAKPAGQYLGGIRYESEGDSVGVTRQRVLGAK